MRFGMLAPKHESSDSRPVPPLQPATQQKIKIRVNPLTQQTNQHLHNDSLNNNTVRQSGTGNISIVPSANLNSNNNFSSLMPNSIVSNYLSNHQAIAAAAAAASLNSSANGAKAQPQYQHQHQQMQQTQGVQMQQQQQQQQLQLKQESQQTTPNSRPPQRRRVRRKANSPSDDQAEHLTEMSVRGLDLFRYAKIFEGIYQCTECAKENIQKTFKNKYSFQRHAFLYHEGTQRKVFPCPVCSKEFSRPDKMKNHMKTTHECYMPKDVVYPLKYMPVPGSEVGTGTPQQQHKLVQKQNLLIAKENALKAKAAAAEKLQNNDAKTQDAKVENVVVTPHIQHLLNPQQMDSKEHSAAPTPDLIQSETNTPVLNCIKVENVSPD